MKVAANIQEWRKIVRSTVRMIGDDALQRRAWLGIGPEQSSPDEAVTQFFGNAAFDKFLQRDDNGLSGTQRESGWRLWNLMEAFAKQTPEFPHPLEVLSHPRWKEIQKVANDFVASMTEAN